MLRTAFLIGMAFHVMATVPGQRPMAVQSTERDRDVLQALLLDLSRDAKFPRDWKADKKTSIVLQTRNPEKTGMIQNGDQISVDVRHHPVPQDALQDLRLRNCRKGSWDSTPIVYSNRTYDPKIIVAEWGGGIVGFFQRFPKAKAYVEAWAPGYSKNGQKALVRAWFGPTPHGATLTAVLNLRDGKWSVEWRETAFYR